MGKIKCNIEKKEIIFSKFNDLVDSFENLKKDYDGFEIPHDFNMKQCLEEINYSFINITSDINFVGQILKDSFYQLEDTQIDILEKILDISTDELPLFDIDYLNVNLK